MPHDFSNEDVLAQMMEEQIAKQKALLKEQDPEFFACAHDFETFVLKHGAYLALRCFSAMTMSLKEIDPYFMIVALQNGILAEKYKEVLNNIKEQKDD